MPSFFRAIRKDQPPIKVISLFSASGKSLAYYSDVDTEAVQQAYDTAVAGNLGPLVDLRLAKEGE
jgi:hypothetical protein